MVNLIKSVGGGGIPVEAILTWANDLTRLVPLGL